MSVATEAAPARRPMRSPARPTSAARIGVACGAHALHDGYTDLIYVMLPLWQAEFGIGYAALGLLAHLLLRNDGGLADSVRAALGAARRAAGAGGRHRAVGHRLSGRRRAASASGRW